MLLAVFFCQAEDGIRDLVRSRGLGDVYKRQAQVDQIDCIIFQHWIEILVQVKAVGVAMLKAYSACLLYTSDAADERSSVDLGGRRIIKKKKNE